MARLPRLTAINTAREHLLTAGFLLEGAGCRDALAKVNDALAAARSAARKIEQTRSRRAGRGSQSRRTP
jgi:hypothetical protein